jgi:ribosomal protein RSM22 (predicted rRNA methylase)
MLHLLNSKIESMVNGHSLKALAKEREALTRLYRGNDLKKELKPLPTDSQRLSYLATRVPATYVAVYKVLMELIERAGGEKIHSLLDVGAGPGTALLAAAQACPELKIATLLERDPGFIDLGRCLTEDIEGIEKKWVCQDMTRGLPQITPDLAIASYCLNELKEQDRLRVVKELFKLTNKFLILLEPGTRVAFESLMQIRECLLAEGAHLIAPCPHSKSCPLLGKDWCHFSARVERSSLHRKTKNATLNYEDEKFSYLIFSKISFEPCRARVLQRPFKGTGYIKLQLCSTHGIENKTVTKKDKTSYCYSRKIECGDDYFYT